MVDAVLRRAVAQSQGRHVLVVVDRPAHALSHAQVCDRRARTGTIRLAARCPRRAACLGFGPCLPWAADWWPPDCVAHSHALPAAAPEDRAGPAYCRLLWRRLPVLIPAAVQVQVCAHPAASQQRQGAAAEQQAAARVAHACLHACAPAHNPVLLSRPVCSRVLVFTAGLLLRLLKTGVYHLSQASLMVLMDAFTGAAEAWGGVRRMRRV